MKQNKVRPEDLRLYAITDRRWLGNKKLSDDVEAVLKGGATFIQLREKHLDTDAFKQEAEVIQKICAAYHVPFIINDNVEIAKAIGADGVHVGQSDMAAGDVRRRLGDDKIIGVSASTVEEALEAERHGTDYLGVGAVFPTGSKDDADAVDAETLKAICEAVHIPVVAIGGITADNMKELSGSGICGISVISALFAQPDPYQAAKTLRAEAEQYFA
ncbi:thiamine phosphate synthase [uncultured Pseudoramibacter sp.]|uniref:thiamine phosphate synthase n=1 Tax=uncultured Pseudoramibacter sp. TaxID=1623493 RepID=UPI0025EC92DA|nr:thiamine phosphate synthase [uncultured Pseudoramibacter sp.]